MDGIEDRQPFILSYATDQTFSSLCRSYMPFYILQMQGKIKFNRSTSFIRDEGYYKQVDVVYVSCGFDIGCVKKLSSMRQRLGFRLVCDVDRLVDEISFKMFDEVVISTPFLKEHYLQTADQSNLAVIPTKIAHIFAGHFYDEKKLIENYIAYSLRPRVLCLGKMDEGLLSDDFEWVFFEGEYCQDKIAALRCQAVVVPLNNSVESHAKSDILLQLAGAHGLPIICQDITPYKRAHLRFRTQEQMEGLLKEVLIDEGRYLEEVRRAHLSIQKDWLERDENLGRYIAQRERARVNG